MRWTTPDPARARRAHLAWLVFYVAALATMGWSAIFDRKDTAGWVTWAVVCVLLLGGLVMKIRSLRALGSGR